MHLFTLCIASRNIPTLTLGSKNIPSTKERETTPTNGDGVNEGCFTLIIAKSSYVIAARVNWAWLWDKSYRLLLEVVPIVTNGKGNAHLIEGDYNFFWLVGCISRLGVTRACNLGFMQHVLGLIPSGVSYRVFFLSSKLFEWIWATCCRFHYCNCIICICLGMNY